VKDKLHVNFEDELPEGYKVAYQLDATDFKTQLFMNLGALGLAVIAGAAVLPWIHPVTTFRDFISDNYGNFAPVLSRMVVFIILSLVYIVLHELTHGAAYKLLTGRKLSFGFSGTVAYCGVRGIKVYRKAALIALLAPFVVFNILFLAGVFLLSKPFDRLLSAIMFVVHFSGCVGDLYDTALYLFKFRDPRTLMEDTGPKQVFYVPEEASEE